LPIEAPYSIGIQLAELTRLWIPEADERVEGDRVTLLLEIRDLHEALASRDLPEPGRRAGDILDGHDVSVIQLDGGVLRKESIDVLLSAAFFEFVLPAEVIPDLVDIGC
jgi:hypothetical protein